MLCPTARNLIKSVNIHLVNLGNFGHEWIIWVWFCQERADGEQDLGYSQSWTPLFLEYVKTDVAIRSDIWVIYLGDELYQRRFEWECSRKVDTKIKNATFIRAVCWSDDGGIPLEEIIIIDWTSAAIAGRILGNILQLLLYPSQCIV